MENRSCEPKKNMYINTDEHEFSKIQNSRLPHGLSLLLLLLQYMRAKTRLSQSRVLLLCDIYCVFSSPMYEFSIERKIINTPRASTVAVYSFNY